MVGSPRPRLHIQPGVLLGRYELLRVLGTGGFAEVWLARLPGYAGFEKLVAIKLLQSQRQNDGALRTMLVDEANIAAKLSHPNVVAVHELGEQQGVLYVVMEHVAGGSLDDLLDELLELGESMPPAIALRMMIDIGHGLHAAHELSIEGRPQGLVHRDVSPQNVLISEGGLCKLIDFGIAKARERRAKETTTGVTKGKLSYMSPEHARGEPLDRRSDLWSLAATAYEIFEGDTVVPHAHPVVQLRVLATEYAEPTFVKTPAALVPVLQRALARDRNARQPTLEALCADLEGAQRQAGLSPASHADVAAFCADVHERARPLVRARVAREVSASGRDPRALRAALEPTQSAQLPVGVDGGGARSYGWLIRAGVAIALAGALAVLTQSVRSTSAPADGARFVATPPASPTVAAPEALAAQSPASSAVLAAAASAQTPSDAEVARDASNERPDAGAAVPAALAATPTRALPSDAAREPVPPRRARSVPTRLPVRRAGPPPAAVPSSTEKIDDQIE